MRPPVRTAAAALVTLLSVVGVAALSRVPYDDVHAEDAVLRLSWRTRGEEVRTCRTLSPEELAALPVHMRRSEVCESRVLSRYLRVRVDGHAVVDDTIRAAGARADRPLYVYFEIPLAPGVHDLDVRFVPEETEAADDELDDEVHDDADDEVDDEREAPVVLALETRLELRPGEVALVTYDADRRELVLRRPAARGAR